jgi:hypothetical protein
MSKAARLRESGVGHRDTTELDMTNCTGNTKVHGGYYLSTSHWNVEVIPAEGGTLPGRGRYLRLPFPLLFALVPLIGLAFLMFLPLIGFALLAQAIAAKVAGSVSAQVAALGATVTPELAHGTVYLTGARTEERAGHVSPELEALEREIARRRSERQAA